MAVILITHDLTVVRQFADRVYVMQHGEVKEHNETAALFASPQHPYTKRFCLPTPRALQNPLKKIPAQCCKARACASFTRLKSGGLFRPDYIDLVAVDSLDFNLKRGETLGHRW